MKDYDYQQFNLYSYKSIIRLERSKQLDYLVWVILSVFDYFPTDTFIKFVFKVDINGKAKFKITY